VFEENPLADFVELPDDGRAQEELWYSNILCGVLRGALEMVRRVPGSLGRSQDGYIFFVRERRADSITGPDAGRVPLCERCAPRE